MGKGVQGKREQRGEKHGTTVIAYSINIVKNKLTRGMTRELRC